MSLLSLVRPDRVGIVGHGFAELWTPDDIAGRNLLRGERRRSNRAGRAQYCLIRGREHRLAQFVPFRNLVTQVGDQYYGERAAGISSPPNQVSGMKLGTGTTAVAKTGAGAALVTYTSGSHVAITATWPQSSIPSSARRIQWKGDWAAGVATATGLAEAVIVNEASLTNATTAAANTIARVLLSPTINKGASDTLSITWNHDLLGA